MGAGHTFPLKTLGDYRDRKYMSIYIPKPELEVKVMSESELLAALKMGCKWIRKYFLSVFYPMEKSHSTKGPGANMKCSVNPLKLSGPIY